MAMDTVDNPFKHAAGLSAVWQKCMSEMYGPEFRLLIGREHGQLKLLKESLGMKRATEVVEYAIRNWGKFAQTAAKTAGSDIFPSKPTVGWLLQYHPTAVTMLHEDLQSLAEEQAKQEAQAQEMPKAMPESKSEEAPITLIHLTLEQLNAFRDVLDNPANEAWADKVTAKYGQWRPDENGIPCDIKLKKAG
jgi:hypothetical protein